jgi:hypothetical protein
VRHFFAREQNCALPFPAQPAMSLTPATRNPLDEVTPNRTDQQRLKILASNVAKSWLADCKVCLEESAVSFVA